MSGPGYSLNVPSTEISRRLSTQRLLQSRTDMAQTAGYSETPLDDLMKTVSMEWKELVSEDSNTLEVALSLMDNSSIGKAKYYSRFETLKMELQDMLKMVVNGKIYEQKAFNIFSNIT